MGVNDKVHGYTAWVEAQGRLRYYDYSLRVDSERLLAIVGREDTTDLVASILKQEAEVERLKLVQP